jgi:hypothetical protein
MIVPPSPIQLPRPNLGPEPWPDAPLWPWIVAAGVVVLLLALVGVRHRRRRKRHVNISLPIKSVSAPSPLTSHSDPVREALAKAFGASWRAKTTEEIAASSALAGRFGDEVAERLVDYLGAIDRAKFSGQTSAPIEELDWWAARFVEEVESGANHDPINN